MYEVYPRSFADANGDGVGDLRGLISRVDYLASLGIDAVWLTPFYPSALADGGYDVDDYRDVDPTIGSLDDFDTLVEALHRRGLRILIDIVPNHSSDRHQWFKDALLAGRGSPERERYLFRDGLGVDGELPPSDWQSRFGGSAWSRVPDGQWYFHMYAPEQPDWNWKNPDVRDDFLRTLRFWADRHVDGFRVDVAFGLTKDLPEVLPAWSELQKGRSASTIGGVAANGSGGISPFPEGQHPLWDRDDVHEVYADWRRVFDSYEPPLMAVAEVSVPPHRRMRYASAEGLGQAFTFDLIEVTWNAARFRQVIRDNLAFAHDSGTTVTWVLSNHDVVRHPTRFGLTSGLTPTEWLLSGAPARAEDRAVGLARAKAAILLVLALPGSAYLYQGEELGLPEVGDLDPRVKADPAYLRDPETSPGRDGCRVPLPWTGVAPSFGFGRGGSHLPQPGWFAEYAVDRQDADEASTLAFYRSALAARRAWQCEEEVEWIESREDVIAFRRPNGWTSVTNFGDEPAPRPRGDVIVSSMPLGDSDVIPAGATVWLAEPRPDGRGS